MPATMRMQVNSSLYLRDPEDTELGRSLVDESILLIDKLGFEKFTFKKLAQAIGSTEASMYRYFESKHKLLSYLLAWYWSRMHFLISYQINNLSDPKEKMSVAIKVLTDSSSDDPTTSHVDEAALHRIVTIESTKAYVLKGAKKGEREALVEDYERFLKLLSEIVSEINPKYKNPRALITMMLHSVQRLGLYSEYFPNLTEFKKSKSSNSEIASFIETLAFRVLN